MTGVQNGGSAHERVRVVVIGGGVVGCAVTRELALRGYEPVLVERDRDVGEGTSKANSAIVHTGFDARPGSIEADMLARARTLWPALVDELGLPFLRVGALMLAGSTAELDRLRTEVRPRARELGVEVEVLDAHELQREAPYVAAASRGALVVPGESVVDPFWLTRAYAETAVRAGARILLGNAVVGLERDRDGFEVRLADGCVLHAAQVINCAGLHADDVAALAGEHDFQITPRKGEFLVSEESFGVDHIVLPIPGPMGKGLLVTPIVFGGLLLGPTAVDQQDKHDRGTQGATRAVILEACAKLVPVLTDAEPVRQFAGLRTVSSSGDYILGPSPAGDRLYRVAGIRSTGISTSPAVSAAVVDDIERLRGWGASRRRVAAAPLDMSAGTPDEASQEIVCLCRSVGAAEVGAALHGPLAATTLDGLKRRCGVTFGDCQGNLCLVPAVTALARAHGWRATDVTRRGEASWLLLEPSVAGAGTRSESALAPRPVLPEPPVDEPPESTA